jgi:catechol 2,3-dioxygenase-like lactoylglutathione lyase family enzyme
MEAVAKPQLTGIGHIDLTVTDGERSVRWWQDVMGFTQVATRERPDFKLWTMMDSSGLVVSIMTHVACDGAPFNKTRVGLDHLAFRVAGRKELEEWVRHLDACGVAHSGIQDELGGPLVGFRDPDNIQLELHALDESDPVVADATVKVQTSQP